MAASKIEVSELGDFCKTTWKTSTFKFTWVLDNVSLYRELDDRDVTSLQFPYQDDNAYKWRLEIRPMWLSDDDVRGGFEMKLRLCQSPVKEFIAEYEITVKDTHSKILRESTGKEKFDLNRLSSVHFLLKESAISSVFDDDDVLLIKVQIKFRTRVTEKYEGDLKAVGESGGGGDED